MKTTIIIVTFKSQKVIYKCLSSINNNYPVIVIENSDNKNLKKQIENKFTNVKCILTGENLGFGKANNIGLRLAKTKYVFLLNPDTVLHKDALEVLTNYAERIKNFALLAPIITNSHELNYGFFNKKKKIKNLNVFEVDGIIGFVMLFNQNNF